MWIGTISFFASLIPIVIIYYFILIYRFGHAGKVCSGDLFNYQEDAAKIPIYEDFLEINTGRFLIALLIIPAMMALCFFILVLLAYRAEK